MRAIDVRTRMRFGLMAGALLLVGALLVQRLDSVLAAVILGVLLGGAAAVPVARLLGLRLPVRRMAAAGPAVVIDGGDDDGDD